MGEREVFAFERNGQETVKASLSEYKGETYVNLSLWWHPPGVEELKLMKKALTIKAELFPELERAVAALGQALRAKGLSFTEAGARVSSSSNGDSDDLTA